MDMLESIKMELDGNDLLLEDYPEVVYPIQSLDGIANRCNGQLYKGERTHIGWTAREIVLPTMPGSSASGAISVSETKVPPYMPKCPLASGKA